MSYDFTLIRKTLKETAEYRRLVKEAYRIPHNTPEHKAAKDRLKTFHRDSHRQWATALHIAYAEARGKTHCDAKAWIAGQFWDKGREKLLVQAKALITERPVATPENTVASA